MRLAVMVLADVWESTDASSAPAQIVQLARHTVSAAFYIGVYGGTHSTSMAGSYSRLCASMDQVALNTRTVIPITTWAGDPPETQYSLDRLAAFVEGLAQAIESLFGPAQWNEHGLTDQRRDYAADRKRLEDMVDAAQEELKGLGNTSGPTN
ncbi:hypothetical protein C8R46DRAFT_1213011 [Mycena filopes]|nr:hypothetical protein C8R46DRAFT_1213011 [Mycena filopes]